jgi:hypothetical protein
VLTRVPKNQISDEISRLEFIRRSYCLGGIGLLTTSIFGRLIPYVTISTSSSVSMKTSHYGASSSGENGLMEFLQSSIELGRTNTRLASN